MSSIRPGHWYTYAELEEFRNDPQLEGLKLKGYVFQQDVNTAKLRFVHWSQATSGEKPSSFRKNLRVFDDGDFGELPPIVKRTPQERVDSLMLRFIEDCKMHGTVPGLSDAMITTIVGEAWKSGETQITGEVVRSVAQHFLTDAEAKATN